MGLDLRGFHNHTHSIWLDGIQDCLSYFPGESFLHWSDTYAIEVNGIHLPCNLLLYISTILI